MHCDAIEIETFETIDGLTRSDSASGVIQILSDAIRRHGFDCFLIADLPPRGSPFECSIILNGWPTDWFEHYVAQRYYDVDPVALHARNAVVPFSWSEAVDASARRRSPRAAKVMAEAADNGLHDGLVVPIVGSAGDQSCVTMGGTWRDRDPKSRNALTLLSMFAVQKARELRFRPKRTRDQEARDSEDEILSPREIECLRWVAAGKTDQDIATILGISSHTVSAHVRRSTAKLNSNTRTQTVVLALHRGLMRL